MIDNVIRLDQVHARAIQRDADEDTLVTLAAAIAGHGLCQLDSRSAETLTDLCQQVVALVAPYVQRVEMCNA